MNGFCIATTSECNPTNPCSDGLICQQGHCILDSCTLKCPVDHVCINNGECRLIQGMFCTWENGCPAPFECINGICVKDGKN